MNAKAAGAAVIVLALGGCASVGVEVHELKPAQGPQGVHVELALDEYVIGNADEIEGELLAVQADGVIVNMAATAAGAGSHRLVRVPFPAIKSVRLEQIGRVGIRSRDREQNLDRLRLLARFPQGLSDDLLAVLLAESGQAQLQVPEKRE
ncbi:MAG TPA: hypothetical protein VFG91_01680 [Woeseiaceae bacterium]|nr:hypothetical protein [Woeseiaceae bacterium]